MGEGEHEQDANTRMYAQQNTEVFVKRYKAFVLYKTCSITDLQYETQHTIDWGGGNAYLVTIYKGKQ